MLTEYVSVNISLCYLEVLGESVAKSCCVKDGSGSHNLILRKTGNLGKYVGHDVYRIAYDDVLGIWSFFYNLRSDALQDVDICLSKLNSCLSRFTGNSGCDDYDVGIFGVCVISCYQGYRTSEAGSLLNVHDFAFDLFLVDVDQNDFGSDFIMCQCVGDCGADASSSDNGNFAAHNKLLSWGLWDCVNFSSGFGCFSVGFVRFPCVLPFVSCLFFNNHS